jgi:hypothetical protein
MLQKELVVTKGLVNVEGNDKVLVPHLGSLEGESGHNPRHVELEQVGRPLDLNVASHLHSLST